MSVAVLERALQLGNLVKNLLEPQLVGLMNHDEQHLVVFAVALGLLQLEQFIDLQVADVCDGFVVRLVGH